MTIKQWKSDKPVSEGAAAYHHAVIHASWHRENIFTLISLIKDLITPGETVVDFGAGTGSSAVYLLEKIPHLSSLLLIDNSPSWLGHAYHLLYANKKVMYMLLEKQNNRYSLLDECIGKERVEHVLAANTVHLIPNIEEVFAGIYGALKPNGSFTFQSGNIMRKGREKDLLMIDDTVTMIHDIALSLIKNHRDTAEYRRERKFIFPDPRPLDFYLDALKKSGFRAIQYTYTPIHVSYRDWISFLTVRRLQAGILPEIEECYRHDMTTKAAQIFFEKLKKTNAFADEKTFTAEWVYVQAKK